MEKKFQATSTTTLNLANKSTISSWQQPVTNSPKLNYSKSSSITLELQLPMIENVTFFPENGKTKDYMYSIKRQEAAPDMQEQSSSSPEKPSKFLIAAKAATWIPMKLRVRKNTLISTACPSACSPSPHKKKTRLHQAWVTRLLVAACDDQIVTLCYAFPLPRNCDFVSDCPVMKLTWYYLKKVLNVTLLIYYCD